MRVRFMKTISDFIRLQFVELQIDFLLYEVNKWN